VTRSFHPVTLHKIMKSGQTLPEPGIQYLIYQILCALKYLDSAGVMCSDLTPGTVLVNRDFELKLTLIGFQSRVRFDDALNSDTKLMHQTVPSLWYSPPEILMCREDIPRCPANVWSAGCILSELILREPLFPGKNVVNQLVLIASTFVPSDEELEAIGGHEKARGMIRFIKSKARPDSGRTAALSKAPANALALIQQMLQCSPSQRCTPDVALRHPYLTEMFDEDDLVVAPGPLNQADLQGDGDALEAISEQIRHGAASFQEDRTTRVAAWTAGASD